MDKLRADVAIIGGGPAGSTVGALLRKYSPELRVVILEREKFPRDHVGESQLPAISKILYKMGVWEKVEAAGFPIKLGGAYRWGATDELWYLNFVSPEDFILRERPTVFDEQRCSLAFQVDRSIFDKVLLDHAKSVGCQVYEEATVKKVDKVGDYVTGLEVSSEELGGEVTIRARYYVDGSGEAGVLRRAMGVETELPTTLRNIAFWDYWTDARWAETIGKGGTRIQVMSLGWGWIWFIPITETRTSVGLVLPAEYYRKSGERPEELYRESIDSEPFISSLLKSASCEGRNLATKDWNFLAERLAGENWFLVGDSCGFADPILSAGMTLAHTSGLKVACSLLELFRKNYDPKWIRSEYSEGHRQQIRQHMRFAEFWYAGNGRFTDLKEYCSQIADSAGLTLKPDEAFVWLGTGGFALDRPGLAGAATFPLAGVKLMTEAVTGDKTSFSLANYSNLRLNLVGSQELPFAYYEDGAISRIVCLNRNGKRLPLLGIFSLIVKNMPNATSFDDLMRRCLTDAENLCMFSDPTSQLKNVIQALEAMLLDGWIDGTVVHRK